MDYTKKKSVDNQKSYDALIDGNNKYIKTKMEIDKDFFTNLSMGQHPRYLCISCIDSRCPLELVTGCDMGDMLVHRNVANIINVTDINALTAIEFAIKYAMVKHIIVVGHTNCGGVRAAMDGKTHGLIDNWLINLKLVYNKYQTELEKITNHEEKCDYMSELNVIEQCNNLIKIPIVKDMIKKRKLDISAWLFELEHGKIKDITEKITEKMT